MSINLSGSVCFGREEAKPIIIVRTAEETESALSIACPTSTPISTACSGSDKNLVALASVENIGSVEGTRTRFKTE